jgi:hypothetical protein
MRVKFEAGGLERGEDYRPLRNNGTEKYAKGEWPCQSGGMCQ